MNQREIDAQLISRALDGLYERSRDATTREEGLDAILEAHARASVFIAERAHVRLLDELRHREMTESEISKWLDERLNDFLRTLLQMNVDPDVAERRERVTADAYWSRIGQLVAGPSQKGGRA